MGCFLMENKATIINCATNEMIEREMTKDELKAEKIVQNRLKIVAEVETAEAEARAATKAALLDRLGISADEAKLLLS